MKLKFNNVGFFSGVTCYLLIFFTNSLLDSLKDSNEKIEKEQKKRETDNTYLNVRVLIHFFLHISPFELKKFEFESNSYMNKVLDPFLHISLLHNLNYFEIILIVTFLFEMQTLN